MFKFNLFKRNHEKETAEQREFVEKQARKIPKALSTIFLVYLILFLSIMSWYFYFKSTYYISPIAGASMQPTINDGLLDYYSKTSEDFAYVNKTKTGQRGDIVTIKTDGDSIIKRIIADEGDKVSIFVAEDGFFHVSVQYAFASSPQTLYEDYVKSYDEWTNSTKYTTFSKKVTDGDTVYEKEFYTNFIKFGAEYKENVCVIDGVYYYEVPKGYVFCLGDNRSVSSDSRIRGAFKKTQIKGVAEIIVKGGSLNNGNIFIKKFNAIFSFYWGKIENLFAR